MDCCYFETKHFTGFLALLLTDQVVFGYTELAKKNCTPLDKVP